MRIKSLEVPGYLVCLILIVFPLTDGILSLMPFKLSEESWRFGALGLLSRTLMTPLFGLFIAFVISFLVERDWMARLLAVMSGVASLCLMVLLPLFALDALQIRGQVQPSARTPFDIVTLVALLKYSIACIISAIFAVTGWRASRRAQKQKRAHASRGEEGGGLVARPQKVGVR